MAWKFNPFTRALDYYKATDLDTVLEVIHVANYSALPDPTTVRLYDVYIVDNAQGNKFWYGSIGGTYYPSGAYYSNLTKWIYSESASKATQAEVDAGTDSEKYITPETFTNASKWTVAGYVEKDSNYTLLFTDDVINCTANNFTISLPTAIGIKGKKYTIVNSGLGTVTLDSFGSETIQHSLMQQIYEDETFDIVSDGNNWLVV
jgi:hypothetical protein